MFLVSKIPGLTPSSEVDSSSLNLPENINYTGPCFFKARRVHILLSKNIFYKIKCKKVSVKNSVICQAFTAPECNFRGANKPKVCIETETF